MTDLRKAAQQALGYMKSIGQMDMYPEDWAIVGRLEAALAQQAEPRNQCGETCERAKLCATCAQALAQQDEPDHETRAELAEQQVVQLAEERDHYRNLWQKAQQAEPVQEPAFHGFMSDDGTQVDVCFSPSAPRRDGTYATAYYTAPPHRVAQQAEPEAYGYASRLAVAIWEKHYKDTAPQWKPLDDLMGVLTQIDNMTSGLTRLAKQDEPEPMPPEQRQRREELAAMPQQAEPLNLADPAVRKRLATQWGYVPAAQVEPVGEILPNWSTEQERIVGTWAYLNDLGTNLPVGTKLYTAPPQRKLVPLTEAEIEHIGITHQSLRQVVRAVERAHGIKEN